MHIAYEAVECPYCASILHVVPVIHCASEAFRPAGLTDFVVPPAKDQLVSFQRLQANAGDYDLHSG